MFCCNLFRESVPWPPWSLAGGFENWLQHNLEECGEVMVPNYFTSARFGHLELELLGLGESEVDGINHRVSLAGRTCTMRTQRGWIKEGGREGGREGQRCEIAREWPSILSAPLSLRKKRVHCANNAAG